MRKPHDSRTNRTKFPPDSGAVLIRQVSRCPLRGRRMSTRSPALLTRDQDRAPQSFGFDRRAGASYRFRIALGRQAERNLDTGLSSCFQQCLTLGNRTGCFGSSMFAHGLRVVLSRTEAQTEHRQIYSVLNGSSSDLPARRRSAALLKAVNASHRFRGIPRPSRLFRSNHRSGKDRASVRGSEAWDDSIPTKRGARRRASQNVPTERVNARGRFWRYKTYSKARAILARLDPSVCPAIENNPFWPPPRPCCSWITS